MTELLTEEECEARRRVVSERVCAVCRGAKPRGMAGRCCVATDVAEWRYLETITQLRAEVKQWQEACAYDGATSRSFAEIYEKERDEARNALDVARQDNKMLHMELKRLQAVTTHLRFDDVMQARNALIDAMYEDGNGPAAEQRAELDVLDAQLDDMTRARDNLSLWPAEQAALYAECMAEIVRLEHNIDEARKLARRYRNLHPDSRNNPLPWEDE